MALHDDFFCLPLCARISSGGRRTQRFSLPTLSVLTHEFFCQACWLWRLDFLKLVSHLRISLGTLVYILFVCFTRGETVLGNSETLSLRSD